MKIGILTRNSDAWCSTQLGEAARKKGLEPVCFQFSDITPRIACDPMISVKDDYDSPDSLKATIVRPIGRGSLEEIIFRLDLLHRMERNGFLIINCPSSIEKAVDKFYALTILEENNLPVPRTIVVEDPEKALKSFHELGGDVVVKPIFGSRGMGIARVSDPEVAERIFRSLAFTHSILYLQEFIPHGTKDIRAFVIGDRVIAAMNRVADDWKTNISKGARSVPVSLSGELEELAIRAAESIGCEISGVDILEGSHGYFVNEVNSQPGFRGLQSTTGVHVAGSIIDYVLRRISN